MGDRYIYDVAAEVGRDEDDGWERVQRQLVILNWILTAATAVGAAALVYSTVG